jgi:hypothetical protein
MIAGYTYDEVCWMIISGLAGGILIVLLARLR